MTEEEREAVERLEFEAAHRAYGDRMAVNVADVRVLLDRLSTPPSVSAREIAEGIVDDVMSSQPWDLRNPLRHPEDEIGAAFRDAIASSIEEQIREKDREIEELKRDRQAAEDAEQRWMEEATYEVGTVPRLWSDKAKAAEARLDKAVKALKEAETFLMIVEPKSHKNDAIKLLATIRAAMPQATQSAD